MLESNIKSEKLYRLNDHDVVSLCCVAILQFVLLGLEDRRKVPDWILRLENNRGDWDMYPWGSYVWPILYSQLRNANVNVGNPYMPLSRKKMLIVNRSLFGFTWAFKRVSSRAFFDGHISEATRITRHVNRQNEDDVPSDFYREFEEQKRVLKEMMKKESAREQMYNQMQKFMEDIYWEAPDLSRVLILNDGSLEESFAAKYIFPNASLAEMINHVITDYTSEGEDDKREVTQNDYTFNQMVEWAKQEHFEDEETKEV
ncbi:hypothetical protein Tco_0570221 [Tanacetum coccineum]